MSFNFVVPDFYQPDNDPNGILVMGGGGLNGPSYMIAQLGTGPDSQLDVLNRLTRAGLVPPGYYSLSRLQQIAIYAMQQAAAANTTINQTYASGADVHASEFLNIPLAEVMETPYGVGAPDLAAGEPTGFYQDTSSADYGYPAAEPVMQTAAAPIGAGALFLAGGIALLLFKGRRK